MAVTTPERRQLSLFATGPPARHQRAPIERIELDRESWLDWSPGWLDGADQLFDWCAAELTWAHGERVMYDRIVAEPRLTASISGRRGACPSPPIAALAHELSERYRRTLDRVFANFYRNGRDSVAWHGDRIGRTHQHPVIAIVSLGGPRTFALRASGGGRARSFEMYSGDLLVMGGACQTRFEHAVPKRRAAEPRISLTFRQKEDRRPAWAAPG